MLRKHTSRWHPLWLVTLAALLSSLTFAPAPAARAQTGGTVYQAEAASFGGGSTAESNNAGFNGTGFINFPATGGFLQFNNVNGGSGGNANLQFRYALGATGSRTGSLIVNGASQSITFNPTGAWTTWVIQTVTVPLNSGASNTVRLESNGQDLANIDQLEGPAASATNTPTPTNTQPGPTFTPTQTQPAGGALQAEAASFGGGTGSESTNGGFNGTGYVNFPASGGFLQFNNVNGGSGGSAALQFRYALGVTGSRTGLLIVNGASQSITFNTSGAWTTWVVLNVNVSLNAGTGNTIRLESNGQDLANIDQLTVGPGGPTSTPTNTQPGPTNTPTRTPTRTPTPTQQAGGRQMERLNRGVVRVNQSGGNFISWRLLGNDPAGIAFNVYQGATRLNASPITNSTNFFHSGGGSGLSYTIRPVINGQEGADSEASLNISSTGFLNVPIQIPPGGTTPDNVSYTYSANDASVGDMDGDGQYEIVLKWDPSNSHDNSQQGYTGNVFVDAYRLNGTRLWRIDLGRNIRAGAHYTQFVVYDLDGDGRAEVAMKTADATISGTGQVIGNGSADHRNSNGIILAGPEFLTVFDGLTGAIRATVNYIPARGGNGSSWGDTAGNRVDRFHGAVAYLDGQRPSLIMTRGYYERTALTAWDFRNGQLTQRWAFDTDAGSGSQFEGQGNHNLSIGDVDNDGRDEIMFGSMAVNDNGTGMYTGFGHGDAMHFGDLVPSRPGLEVWTIHESDSVPGASLRDANTGQILFQRPNNNGVEGPGRAVADDIWTGNPGAEYWGSGPNMGNLFNASGNSIGRTPGSANHLIWWDADPLRELMDGNHIDKYGTSSDTRLLTATGATTSNGTKSNPALTADLFGDWREEAIWRTDNSSALRIYTTTAVTTLRIYTLMHNAQYRVSIAWQQSAYNQPPHTSFFLGDGMSIPPQPNIFVVP